MISSRLLIYLAIGAALAFAVWRFHSWAYQSGWDALAAQIAAQNEDKERRRERLQSVQDEKDRKTLQNGEQAQADVKTRAQVVREANADADLSPDVPATHDTADPSVCVTGWPDPFTERFRLRVNAGLTNGLPRNPQTPGEGDSQPDAESGSR